MAREPMQMPDMNGANMSADNPMRNLPPEAKANLMQPDETIAGMLVARLSAMSEEELRMLDTVITPEVAQVLVKLLPELEELISAVGAGEAPSQADPRMAAQADSAAQMGALGGMG
jgi:hypothetical protein|tara:strand:- start:19 stop:366 length:348 start_codon:yes stop_codon:yes gene_type:complete